MKAALAVATMYPARPSKPLPSSPSIDTLRTVLATTAWVLDYAAEYGKRVEGLVDHHPLLVRPVNCYDWSGDYLKLLFTAILDHVEEQGLGVNDWKSMRWEVYDKARLFQVFSPAAWVYARIRLTYALVV